MQKASIHNIHQKTLQDLEFATVLSHIQELCTTEHGKEKALGVLPYNRKEMLFTALKHTSEYMASFDNNNKIPGHYFDSISQEIKLLGIENTLIELGGFKKIAGISNAVNVHILFFRKFKEYYPTLHQTAEQLTYTTAITEEINRIIDRFGEIKDDASATLASVRGRSTKYGARSTRVFSVPCSPATVRATWTTSGRP